MADNDLEIEGLIDSIRGSEPSQESIDPNDGAAEFISVEEVMAGGSMTVPNLGLLFGTAGLENAPMMVSGLIPPQWADQYPNNNLTIQAADGPSVTISSSGVITMSNGGQHINSFSFDMRQQAQYIEDLRQRVHTLENLVNLLGTALNAQIDNDTMAGLNSLDRFKDL